MKWRNGTVNSPVKSQQGHDQDPWFRCIPVSDIQHSRPGFQKNSRRNDSPGNPERHAHLQGQIP